MDAERLRQITYAARISDANFSHGLAIDTREAQDAIIHRNELLDHLETIADEAVKLFDYIAELTRQRDDARRMAVASGYWQNYQGTEYPEPGPKFHADPVGPVAWTKSIEQT